MFDTHCHLNFKGFDNDVASLVKDAGGVGVKQFLVPGVDLKTSRKAITLADDHVGIYAAVGVHPTQKLTLKEKERLIFQLRELISLSSKVVAIGEIGLDYYRYRSDPEVQKVFFKEQVKLAGKLGKSVVVHNRRASPDITKYLEEAWLPSLTGRVVFHCCPAEDELLEYAQMRKIYIGVDGDVTYDKVKQKFVKKIPLDLLVLETDSPFLIPEPLRRKRIFPNKPENLVHVATYVSNLKDISQEKLIQQTNLNSQALFCLK